MVERILLNGEDITFVRSNPDIDLGMVFGIFKNKEQKVCISNEIFELFIYEYMISVRRNRDYRLSKSRDASMPLAQTKFYTEDDYYTLPENVRAELIDGYLVYNQAAPSRIHQTILMELSGTIREYIKSKKGSCRVYPAPFAVKLMEDRETIVEPDISIICDRNKLTDRGCSGAPDWIIEIVSPSNSSYDYITKLNLYADAGVREYWIVTPSKETVFVYYLEKTDFKVETYTFQDNIKVNIYEDFSIDFTELDL